MGYFLYSGRLVLAYPVHMKGLPGAWYIQTTPPQAPATRHIHTQNSCNSWETLQDLIRIRNSCFMDCFYMISMTSTSVLRDIQHFVERHFVYSTISSKKLFIEVSFCRMSTSSKHVLSNTFDEIFCAHLATIIYLLIMWPLIFSIANSELFRANIPRSDGFHSLEQFLLSWLIQFQLFVIGLYGLVQQRIAQFKYAFIKFWDRIFIHFNVTCRMKIRQKYFIW